LPIEVIAAGSLHRFVLVPTSKDHHQEFPLNDLPTRLDVDPGGTVLKELAVQHPD
jgi:hypothetical protein